MRGSAGSEIVACCETVLAQLSEETILREGAWVILSVGFRAEIVRRIFPSVSRAFRDWSSASLIIEQADACMRDASHVFNNPVKLGAIIALAQRLASTSTEWFASHISDGVAVAGLPMFGPVSSLHLQMNLGVATAKPDRHLRRLADNWGFSSAQDLCAQLAAYTGDDIRMIDRVLWHTAIES